MPRDYQGERDALVRRWYGGYNPPSRFRRRRNDPVTPADCFGIRVPVNSPFTLYGHCLVWKHGLNRDGYGVLTIDSKQQLAHRVVFVQTRGQIPEDSQVNHLCNRPYCVQPSHLYAGSAQDNKDDSQIFAKEELLHAPWILYFHGQTKPADPLRMRLLESGRYAGAEPWEPEVQPAQIPFEEFICPGHDFAIPMLSGHSMICRICETSEFWEDTFGELEIPSLIAELCPVSQMVEPIWEKIFGSDFTAESHRDVLRKASYRSRGGFGHRSHRLRTCECRFCCQDREFLRTSIDARLTREESQVLDACDRLAFHVASTLEEASARIMEAWAGVVGLDEKQALALKEHGKDCSHTENELTGTSLTIESGLGYLLYALTEFDGLGDMLDDDMGQSILRRAYLVRIREEELERINGTILPIARDVVVGLDHAWERETAEFTRPYLKSKPELCEGVGHLVYALAMNQVVEYLRYEFFGRGSFGGQKPHPHSYCVASMMESGTVRSFPEEFEEGKGYRRMEP